MTENRKHTRNLLIGWHQLRTYVCIYLLSCFLTAGEQMSYMHTAPGRAQGGRRLGGGRVQEGQEQFTFSLLLPCRTVKIALAQRLTSLSFLRFHWIFNFIKKPFLFLVWRVISNIHTSRQNSVITSPKPILQPKQPLLHGPPAARTQVCPLPLVPLTEF